MPRTRIVSGCRTRTSRTAGTMAEMARMALAEDFRHIDPRSAHVLLFEAAPRILPTCPETLPASFSWYRCGTGRPVDHAGSDARRSPCAPRVPQDPGVRARGRGLPRAGDRGQRLRVR